VPQRALERSRNDRFLLAREPATVSSTPAMNPVVEWCSAGIWFTVFSHSAASLAFSWQRIAVLKFKSAAS